eukprot:1802160-Amphidinium_carterae.1
MSQCASWAQQRRLSMSIIYLDVRSAFDAVLRQLLIPEEHQGQSAVEQLHRITQRPVEECELVVQLIRESPSSLLAAQLPEKLVTILSDWTTDTWFAPRDNVQGISSEEGQNPANNKPALQPATGVRQGDNLSGLLFAVYMEQALERVHNCICQSSCRFSLPKPEHRTLQIEQTTMWHDIAVVTYADDIAIPLQSPNPGTLIEGVKQVLEQATLALKDFNFEINTAWDKSAVSLALRSKHAPRIWQNIREEAFEVGENGADLQADRIKGNSNSVHRTLKLTLQVPVLGPVHIQQIYNHLGRQSDVTGSAEREVQARISAAHRAFAQHQRVLTSVSYTLCSRLYLYNMYVLSVLTLNLHVIPGLTDGQLGKLQRVHVMHLRKVCRIVPLSSRDRGDGQEAEMQMATRTPTMSTERFLNAVGQPSITSRVSARRLRLLARVVACDHDSVRAVLTVQGTGTMWQMWHRDMEELQVRLGGSHPVGRLPALRPSCPMTWTSSSLYAQIHMSSPWCERSTPKHRIKRYMWQLHSRARIANAHSPVAQDCATTQGLHTLCTVPTHSDSELTIAQCAGRTWALVARRSNTSKSVLVAGLSSLPQQRP